MVKKLLYLLLLLFSFTTFSQEITRIKINGKITASKGEDVEGINILNKTSQEGTITSKNGEFELMVAENDRVFVSAIQFQRFSVIIDEGIIENKTMFIYLNPVVNQLDEIVIRPFDISGNIVADVKRVNVISVNSTWDLSYENLEYGYEFSDDAQSSIRGNKAEEAYFNGPVQGGGDTFVLVSQLYKNNVMQPLREAIFNGLAYLGTSAGSNICGTTINTTNDMPIVYPPSFKCLGVLPFNINPHYLDPDPNSKHMGETRETRIMEFHTQNTIPVVGIREGSWLRVKGNTIVLKGSHSARIFEQGKKPIELNNESNLDIF